MSTRLADISRCFQGVIPSMVATSDRNGTPNVTYVSQVYVVDEGHVALSCQFFNKTRRNLDENPRVCAEVYDPVTFQAYRLHLRFLRSEKTGPLFETMAVRIEAIASVTGMKGIFKLIAADVFEVLRIEPVEGFLDTPPADACDSVSVDGLRSEIRGLQYVSEKINRAADLESLLDGVLDALDTYFGFSQTMVLLYDECTKRLTTIASRGYGESGVGAEVATGEGLIGTVACERRLLRISRLEAELRYGRAIRREAGGMAPEVPLPGLPDAQSALVIPLSIGDRLIGVLAAEDRDPLRFGEWHEAYLEVVGNQIALGIDRMADDDSSTADRRPPTADSTRDVAPAVESAVESAVDRDTRKRTFTFYRNDDCVFVDGDYLIRNVPGRILWKLLNEWRSGGRTEFTNRELRLDTNLGLPPVKDNLESRLILLRRRLDEKCPDVRLEPVARGRFALRLGSAVELVER
ncbi:MAG TPA: GAF domain-containing protein [Thermoanaerobaculia bacterium]|nr:GAF domain-containing protein [Thermoanaerobaculia bacterium]